MSAPARSSVAGTQVSVSGELGSCDDLGQRSAAEQHVVDGRGAHRWSIPSAVLALPCGSRSMTQHAQPVQGERGGEIHRAGGLADAALLVGDGDDPGLRRARPVLLAHVHDMDGLRGLAGDRRVERCFT